MADLAPDFYKKFTDDDGNPLNGGKIYTYLAGTNTPLATYTDYGALTQNTNPIILDDTGYAPIRLAKASYKFVVKDADDNLLLTVDNVNSIAYEISAGTSSQSVIIPYSAIQTASTTVAITLFSLPARALLKNVTIKHSQQFLGGSISAVSAEVGISGNAQEFIENFDVFQVVGDQVFDNSQMNYIGSFANATNILLTMVSVGANLSSLTQGSLTVYYDYENL